MASSATRVFVPLVLLFLVAVLMARLLLTGGWAWAVFALSAPIVLAFLAARIGFLPALAIVALYAGTVLLLRLVLLGSALGAVTLLLLPVLALAGKLSWNVVRTLREGPAALGIEGEEE